MPQTSVRHKIESILAWVGSLGFGLCAIPAAYAALKNNVDHTDILFLMIWGLGEVCMMSWAILRKEYVLLTNYIPNFICLVIMVYFNSAWH